MSLAISKVYELFRHQSSIKLIKNTSKLIANSFD